jgi:hypothetical protein
LAPAHIGNGAELAQAQTAPGDAEKLQARLDLVGKLAV